MGRLKQVAVFTQKTPGRAHDLAKRCAEALSGVQFNPALGGHVGVEPGPVELEDHRDEGVLVLEAAIDRAHGQSGFSGQLRHGEAVEGAGTEQALQRGHKFVPRGPRSRLAGRFGALTHLNPLSKCE